jgi:predicted dehydrogenase/threonine dehydrogenase-like Zn-dependent dehydrogenase
LKQILQSFKTGETLLEDVPRPLVGRDTVLIKTTRSLISLGTERMLVEFGKSNLVSKARQQPERVIQVLDKIKSEGFIPTLETVFSKLEQPLPLGYCNVGKVVAVGAGISEYSIGDRVASNGQHAEYVNIPKNLVAKIPDNISDEEATFTVIGSIGLQGIRLCNPTFGETFTVIGLGLIGLLSAQILKGNGCRVVGIDVDQEKCKIAEKFGIFTVNPSTGSDPIKSVLAYTNGSGVDGVLITASTKSNDVISQAAQMSRKRGRIVLIGVVGLNINRAEFFEKELSFQVSCSYGPGRYDETYEYLGRDYPLPYVRWTEQRNFTAVLQAISSGQIKVNELISEVIDLEEYQKIYGEISRSSTIASILKYPESSNNDDSNSSTIQFSDRVVSQTKGIVGIIGAGNFTKMTMLPALKASGAELKSIASASGVTGTALAKKYDFMQSTSDYLKILGDDDIDTVLVTTRHNTHAKLVIEALLSEKHVFVEKPLALNKTELDEIIEALKTSEKSSKSSLTVGFNRRFSPHIRAIKNALGSNHGPININATMNAGSIPANVWVHDLQIGGGRIIGEACHYLDLCVYLTGSLIKSICMNALGENPAENTDNVSILIKFINGSNATVNYFANGAKSYSKERVEVYSEERVFVVDNFRSTKGFGVKGFKNLKTKIDKGHKAQFHEYIKRIQRGGEPLIPIREIINVTRSAFAAVASLKERKWIEIQ